MKLFYPNGKTSLFSILLLLLICCGTRTMSQTTLTTTFANNNGFSIVTFNFTNNNTGAVMITDIASVCGASGSMAVAAYYKASAINGAPGTIDAGNGWNQFGSATITAVANTTTSVPQPFMTGLSLIVPAGATYGIAVEAEALQYSTLTPGTYTTVGGGAVITTGSNIGYAGDLAPNAPTFTPRGFIGSLTFTSAAPCTGTPAPGNTLSTANPVCAGINFTLSTQNPTAGSGVGYQWQKSPDGTNWTDITGATNTTYTTSQTVQTWYRANVTCSGNTVASTPLLVTLALQANCYCMAASTDTDPIFEKIANVTFGTINNNSTSFVGYEDFTSLTPVANFAAGSSAPITVTGNGNTYPGDFLRVWIDFNQNGNFLDAGELVYTSAAGAGPYTGVITFPASATVGNTRMRIRLYDGTFGNGNNTPCGDNTYGEVEDYLVNITPCIVGTIDTQPTSVTTNCGGTATFTVDATGTGLTYQWQERTSASAPWTIVSNGGIYSGASTATLTLTGAPASSTGHQFQVAIGGGCTPVFLSSTVTLTVSPLVATIGSSLPIQICNTGGPAPITITNASGGTTTLSIPSATPLAIPIPEGNVAGINNGINVTTIPAGVSIVGLSVKVNVTHTWVGDLLMVLQAPNGARINLLAVLNGTGGVAPTTGLVNTVISSEGTDPLDENTADPFTGTFAANLILGPIVGLGAGYPPSFPTGPTGFAPTTANWNDLYSTANGTWTLAIYDVYDDSGVPTQPVNLLNNWAINITYGAPATGVFTPSTGLFTDAAGTVPYTGTAVNTVYANPTASTTYSLVVTTPSCTSAALDIPVLVASAISGTSTVTVTAACEGGTATLTSSAPSGGTVYSHQWQVSTDGGTTFTDVTNGAVYSGANTSTLSITGLTTAMNGNQYQDSIFVTSCNSFVVSEIATLTVNPLPDVQISAGPATQLYPGLKATITAAVSPNAAATYQWYKDGLPVAGETGKSIEVNIDQLGDYSVSITDIKGCSGNSSAITISSAPNAKVFIYPSPNTGLFQVRYYATPGNALPRTVTIYDSKGSRIYSATYNNTEPYSRMDVDMTSHGKGIYHVELTDRNGRRIKTGSVIIL